MFKIKNILLIILVILPFSTAGCRVYHEQAFKGTILDVDTKQPIEGAVVVAQYSKQTWFLAPSSMSSIMDVRETLTDKEGSFAIASYMTLLTPFSWKIPTEFIIFKAGYASVQTREFPFTGEEMEEVVRFCTWTGGGTKCKFRRGIVEIPQISTSQERRGAMGHAMITGYERQLPLLYDALNKESKQLNIPAYH